MIDKTATYKGLIEFMITFNTEKVCIKHLAQMRWENKPTCVHCGHTKIYQFSDYIRYKCAKCRKQFTATKGTIFESSKISLQKWFVALYLSTNNKKGISSLQLSKHINVTQKTAWFMLHRIRQGIFDKSPELLEGIIEVDETYVGGKSKNKHYNKRKKGQQGRGRTEKTPVFGMIQRNGIVRSMKVKDVKGETLKPLIYQHVESGATIMSDEWFAYRGLSVVYNHNTCDHGAYQYVNGDCYTNNMECYWSHVKRSIIGTFHSVSRKHMDRYCYEFDFRYNTRHITEKARFEYAFNQIQTRLTYKQLIAA